MLNSAWPSLYWQLYDYYLVPTAAYYSVKKANLPQQLIYNYKDHAVYLVNESSETMELSGGIELYGMDSEQLLKKELKWQAEPYTAMKIFELGAPEKNSFLMLRLLDDRGGVIADNGYCLSVRSDVYDWDKTNWIHTPLKSVADFTALANLPTVAYNVDVVQKEVNGKVMAEVMLLWHRTSNPVLFPYPISQANIG